MKQLHDKTNIIPVIAKADTMTPEECSAFKSTVMGQIQAAKIKIALLPARKPLSAHQIPL